MKASRGLLLLLVLTGLALGVVHLRAEQARSSARALRAEAEWIALRNELWAVRTHIARLRAPEQVRTRADYFGVDLVPPAETARDSADDQVSDARR